MLQSVTFSIRYLLRCRALDHSTFKLKLTFFQEQDVAASRPTRIEVGSQCGLRT